MQKRSHHVVVSKFLVYCRDLEYNVTGRTRGTVVVGSVGESGDGHRDQEELKIKTYKT